MLDGDWLGRPEGVSVGLEEGLKLGPLEGKVEGIRLG